MGRKLLQKMKSGQDAKITLAGALLLVLAAFCGATLLGAEDPEKKRSFGDTVALTETVAANPSELETSVDGTPDGETVAKLEGKEPVTKRDSRKGLAPPRASVGSAGRMVVGLLFVLILGAGGLLFGRKFLKKVRMTPKGERVLQIVDAIPLGGKRQVYVLEVYGRRLVVGATPESLSTLSEFEADELADEMTVSEMTAPVAPTQPTTFELPAPNVNTAPRSGASTAQAGSTTPPDEAPSPKPEPRVTKADAPAVTPGVLPKDFEDLIRRKSAGISSLEIEA